MNDRNSVLNECVFILFLLFRIQGMEIMELFKVRLHAALSDESKTSEVVTCE